MSGYAKLGWGIGGWGSNLPSWLISDPLNPPPQLFSNATFGTDGYGDGGYGDGGYGGGTDPGGNPIWQLTPGSYGQPGYGEGGYGDGGPPPAGALLGIVDGINAEFKIGVFCKRAQIFVNGKMQTLTIDCSFGGTSLVFMPGHIPPVMSIINVFGWPF